MSIEVKEAAYDYVLPDGRRLQAVSPTTLSVAPGEFVAIVGANGSGKSTLAKLMNGLLAPTAGLVMVDGRPTTGTENAQKARRAVGMVFQNPDNQLVATIVEDDVAFGPENLGVPPERIRERVDEALRAVGMYDHRFNDPHYLSAGQRQKVAIAGILAMSPDYIVLDEPTSMLDPAGRRDVLRTLGTLRRERDIGVVLITHAIEEAAGAERVIVLRNGRIIADGDPHEVLTDEQLMAEASLYATKANRLARRLAAGGVAVSADLITIEEVAQALCL